jgi:diguanylate cyclase (GGDEF)-like protein
MKPLLARDCLCPRVRRVREEDRPPHLLPEGMHFAVFAGDVRDGVFCGLASLADVALHPDWIFADLVEHRPLSAVPPDLPLRDILRRMRETRREALPVVDEAGRFVGVVSQRSVAEALLRQERRLLAEVRQLYRLAQSEKRELAAWARRMARLHEASRTLLNVLAHTALEDELLQAGIEALADLLEAKYGAIGILNAEGGLAHFVYTGVSEAVAQAIGHRPEGRGLLGLVIQENMPIRLDDMRRHPMSAGFPPGHPPMTSLLAVPVSHAGRVYGRIYLCDKKDGTPFSEADELLAMSFAHSLSLMLDNAREVEEILAARRKLDYLAHFDILTGLPNRELFTDRIRQAIAHAHRTDGKVALLFVDLDNFKGINDSYGHAVGDQLLKEVAARLKACVREDDTVARLAGDEFIVMLPDVETVDDAATVARKILEVLAHPLPLEGNELYTGASIGISLFPVDAADGEELLRTADLAMYRAKQEGRNDYRFYTNRMNVEITRRTQIEQGLRKALERGELTLHYQPQRDLRSGRVEAAEALLRWQSPTLGAVSPAEFIPVAESSGLIVPIGLWVLETACHEAARWQARGVPLRVAVNLSPRQLLDRQFAERLSAILQHAGLLPSLLELEITESVMMENIAALQQVFSQLRGQGIQLAIDDFGTGFSSFSYLKALPIDRLKIDKSFVDDIERDPNDHEIIRAIIAMAHALGMRAIAEGVETQTQLELLYEAGCDEVQGYHVSRPVAASALEGLVGR